MSRRGGYEGASRVQVLHVNNPANVAWGLANALRDAGHAAHVLDLYPSPHGYPTDLHANARGKVRGFIATPGAARIMTRYDVVHLHDCDPLAARLARALSKPRVVLHHHGSLLRSGRAPEAPEGAAEIVATPDLRSFRPEAVYLPAPAPRIDAVAHPRRTVARVGHYPSDPSKKGTREIVRAASPWVEAGRIELDVQTGLTHAEVLERIAACDAIVDQWTPEIGAYGVVSIEAMLTGRPVVSSANPAWYPSLPTLGATLEEAFATIAQNPTELPALGEASRTYALAHHDRHRIAGRLLELYGARIAEPVLTRPAEAATVA